MGIFRKQAIKKGLQSDPGAKGDKFAFPKNPTFGQIITSFAGAKAGLQGQKSKKPQGRTAVTGAARPRDIVRHGTGGSRDGGGQNALNTQRDGGGGRQSFLSGGR